MEEAAEKRGITSFRPIDEVSIKEGIWGEGNERSRCAGHFKRRISAMEAEGLWVEAEGSNQGWDQEDCSITAKPGGHAMNIQQPGLLD